MGRYLLTIITQKHNISIQNSVHSTLSLESIKVQRDLSNSHPFYNYVNGVKGNAGRVNSEPSFCSYAVDQPWVRKRV